MKYLFIMVIALVITACTKEAEYSKPAGRNYTVDTLFTHEGCTVYRFADDGYKYFTNCKEGV